MTTTPATDDSQRRALAARRTAWIAAVVAALVYVAFLATAVF